MSMIGTMLALVGLIPARRQEPPPEFAEMLEHIKETEKELAREKDRYGALMASLAILVRQLAEVERERDHLRDAHAYLLSASHACQHQAQLNRAFAQAQQNLQAQALAHGPEGWPQNFYSMMNVPEACMRHLTDCNMHRAELQSGGRGRWP